MKKNKDYTFDKIETFASKNDYNVTDSGDYGVGKSFIVLEHNEKDTVISFVLTGATDNNGTYTCIYSDI